MWKRWIVFWSLMTLALAAPLPETSIYQLPSRWSDQQGQSINLADLQGKVQVLAMIYTHCQSVCPAILEGMKKTEGQLTSSQRQQVGFVLVSIDPRVDTSAQLKAYADAKKLGPAWRLLRGSPEDVRELAATLDFKYRKTSSKDYAHSAMITVLDPQGEVLHQQVGLSGGEAERLKAIQQCLQGR